MKLENWSPVIEKVCSGRFWLAIIAGICIMQLTFMVCSVTKSLVEAETEQAIQIVLMVIPVLSGLIGGVVGFYFHKSRSDGGKTDIQDV